MKRVREESNEDDDQTGNNNNSAKKLKSNPTEIDFVIDINFFNEKKQIKNLETQFYNLSQKQPASKDIFDQQSNILEQLYELHAKSKQFSKIYDFLITNVSGISYFSYMIIHQSTAVLKDVIELLTVAKTRYKPENYNLIFNQLHQCIRDLPIHIYAKNGDIQSLTKLMTHSSSIFVKMLLNFQDANGDDPLLCAIKSGKLETAKLMIDKSWYTGHLIQYLEYLINQDRIFDQLSTTLIDKIVVRADPNNIQLIKNFKYSNGNNLAHAAAMRDQLESLKKLLTLNPDFVNSKGCNQYTPILYSILYAREEIFNHLIEKGALFSNYLPNNQSLLHLAIEKHPGIALKLIENHYCDIFENKYQGKNSLEHLLSLISSKTLNDKYSITDYIPVVKALFSKGQTINKQIIIDFKNTCKQQNPSEQQSAFEDIYKLLAIYIGKMVQDQSKLYEYIINLDALSIEGTSIIEDTSIISNNQLSALTGAKGLTFETEFPS